MYSIKMLTEILLVTADASSDVYKTAILKCLCYNIVVGIFIVERKMF